MEVPSAKDLMTPSPAWCLPDDTLESVARQMAEHDCGAIPVVNDPISRRPVGMITDRDIVTRVVARGRSLFDCAVRDVMTPQPVSVRVDASFHDCARAMMAHRIRRIIVVDDRGKVIGIVTDGDLARASRCDPRLEHDVAAMVKEVSASCPQSPPRPVGALAGPAVLDKHSQAADPAGTSPEQPQFQQPTSPDAGGVHGREHHLQAQGVREGTSARNGGCSREETLP